MNVRFTNAVAVRRRVVIITSAIRTRAAVHAFTVFTPLRIWTVNVHTRVYQLAPAPSPVRFIIRRTFASAVTVADFHPRTTASAVSVRFLPVLGTAAVVTPVPCRTVFTRHVIVTTSRSVRTRSGIRGTTAAVVCLADRRAIR